MTTCIYMIFDCFLYVYFATPSLLLHYCVMSAMN